MEVTVTDFKMRYPNHFVLILKSVTSLGSASDKSTRNPDGLVTWSDGLVGSKHRQWVETSETNPGRLASNRSVRSDARPLLRS